METKVTLRDRPQRWQQPFGPDMTDEDVERVLAIAPFCDMDTSRFPASTKLADIIRYDARVIRAVKGQIIVREGDYGNSAFNILSGQTRAVIGDLPVSMLGRSQLKKKGFFGALSQLWSNTHIPERRVFDVSKNDDSGESSIVLKNSDKILEDYKTAPIPSGAMFGELAALGRIPRAVSVFAEVDTELLEIRWQGLREITRFEPDFKRRVEDLYRSNAMQHYLEETDLFTNVSGDNFQEILDKTLFETYGSFDWNINFKSKRGKEPIIAQEGDYPDGLLLIRAGFARVSIAYGGGRRTLKYLSAGDVYGLHEVYDQSQGKECVLETTLSALGYVDVLRIPLPILNKYVFPSFIPGPERLRDAESRPLRSDQGEDWLVENRFINATQAMLIDLDKCVRCDDCVRACSSTHGGNPRFKRHGKTFDHWMVANACMHCIDPVCMIGCPTGAIHRSKLGGMVVINDETCIGCGTCANSCPYDNITLVEINDSKGLPVVDPKSLKPIQKATKCDLCFTNPGGPACVRACPHDALQRVDFDHINPVVDQVESA